MDMGMWDIMEYHEDLKDVQEIAEEIGLHIVVYTKSIDDEGEEISYVINKGSSTVYKAKNLNELMEVTNLLRKYHKSMKFSF